MSRLEQVPIVAGTVNRGSEVIGGGMIANDWVAFCGGSSSICVSFLVPLSPGMDTTATELSVVESVLNLHSAKPSDIVQHMRSSLIDSLG